MGITPGPFIPTQQGSIPASRLKGYNLPFFLACSTFFLLILASCANPIPPSGGPQDKTPPKLDTLASSRNMQTLFQKQDIILTFDEWVELRDVFNQVIVSPPLEYRPRIERKKKSIVFQFDDRELLRDSATYVINFGEAIRDLTEGNTAQVVFVFSTGNYIDSLSVQGEIIDAYSGEPVENVLFMMYENLADSVFRTDRPFYFARTDKTGKFQVNNVKSGTFKATALADQNLNYRFDNEAEKIGFLDSALSVSALILPPTTPLSGDSTRTSLPPPDSLSTNPDSLSSDSVSLSRIQSPAGIPSPTRVRIRLFEQKKKLFLRDKETGTYGLASLVFNREPWDARVSSGIDSLVPILEYEKDTIRFWYTNPSDQDFMIFVSIDTLIDTVRIESGRQADFYTNASLKAASKAPAQPPVITPGNSFSIAFNHPIASFDNTRIHILEDTLSSEVPARISLDSLNPRNLSIELDEKENTSYEVVIEPDGLIDIFGLANADTIRQSWKNGAVKDFGTLTLHIGNLSPDTAFLIRLLGKNDQLFESFQVADTSEFTAFLPLIPPAVYKVELIEDLDRNGRWSTGDYDNHIQPERVQRVTLQEVRANWEVDAEIEWDKNPDLKPLVPATPPAGSLPPGPKPPGNRN